MASFSCSLWQCSTCTYAENEWTAVECKMCGTVIRAKCPASPILATVPIRKASNPSKLLRKMAKARKEAKKLPPPQDPSPLMHPSGIVVEIVGTERGDQGRSCEEHNINCGEVLAEDVVVRLRKEQLLVEGKEEMAIAAVWINDGIDCCRIGFLPRHMVKHTTAQYEGAVAQVTRDFSGDPEACDSAEHCQSHKNHGCCLTAIIARPLNHPNE